MTQLHFLAAAAILALTPPALRAAALTDGTTGAVQSLSGRFTVPQSLGTVRGANLFHGFTRFSIAPGESATFTTSDAGIRHVISRVSGSEASTFQGLLKLDAASGGRPDFWFINPNGITVGAGAVFDVPAGLHIGAAPQLRLADGTAWDARSGGASTLSVAAPESFGFLAPGGAPAAGALRWQDAALTLQPGNRLTLAGGTLAVERAVLSAPSGSIAVSSPQAVALTDGGRLEANAASLDAAGAIRVDAGTLTIDAGSSGRATGLRTEAARDAQRGGGLIELRVAGAFTLANGADITTATISSQPAGGVQIRAGSLAVAGGGVPTGIGAFIYGSGEGAGIDINVTGSTVLTGGGQVFASTFGAGGSGPLAIDTRSLTIDGEGYFAFVGTQALRDSRGDSGALALRVRDALSIAGGGQVSTSTIAAGRAGALTIDAGSVRLDDRALGLSTGVQSTGRGGPAGPVGVATSGTVQVLNGAAISTLNNSTDSAGAVTVSARSVVVDGGGVATQIAGLGSGIGSGAAVTVTASERVTLGPGGQINSASIGSGGAGTVRVTAPTIDLNGAPNAVTSISASVLESEGGRSGDVTVQAQRLTMTGPTNIWSTTSSDAGRAGDVTVTADTLAMDGRGRAAGIQSIAFSAGASAGTVRVEARDVAVRSGAGIITSAFGLGSSGAINVKAGTLLVDGTDSPESYTGIGGDSLAGGSGAPVTIDASRITLRAGGQISSSTFFAGNAGTVRINADTLTVEGSGAPGGSAGIGSDSVGSGRAGNIVITAREVTVGNGALVSSSALASGPGGSISIDAEKVTLDGSGGVFSVAAGSGAAGGIDIRARDALVLTNGGVVATNTGGSGAAGRITVSAGSLTASGTDPQGFRSGFVSRAREESSGQPGTVTIDVAGTARLDGSVLSIANNATVANPGALQPTTLALTAGEIALSQTEITAAATANANAGRIVLRSAGRITLEDSRISTSALDGDGGPISVSAGGQLRLRDSSITTSVAGRTNGNGGDIAIAARALILESGFVQANTAAARARGGNVNIDVGLLVPDGSRVVIGGNRIEDFRAGVSGFNVIQAAAPDGVGGVLAVTIPELNLSGSLVGLSTQAIDFGLLSRDFCQIGGQSSLTVLGRGGIVAPASAPLRIER